MPFDSNTQINLCRHQEPPTVEVHYTRLVKFSNEKLEEQLKDLPEVLKSEIRERQKTLGHRTFILRSNGKNSLYQIKDDAQEPDRVSEHGGGRKTTTTTKRAEFGYSNYFKDFENDEMINQRFLRGETYLIKEDLGQFNWEIGSEIVDIGGYSCRQATIASKNGNVTRAWFTDDIPIPDGPSIYHGLPGLILKVEVGNMEIAASTVQLHTNMEISKPTDGKITSKEEMDRIAKEYLNRQDDDKRDGNRRVIRKIIRTN